MKINTVSEEHTSHFKAGDILELYLFETTETVVIADRDGKAGMVSLKDGSIVTIREEKEWSYPIPKLEAMLNGHGVGFKHFSQNTWELDLSPRRTEEEAEDPDATRISEEGFKAAMRNISSSHSPTMLYTESQFTPAMGMDGTEDSY